jgi:serine/threonine protein kinase
VITSGVSALPYDDSAGFTAPPAFGTFRVLHQIGSGGLGPVFRAFEPQQERLIAVKAFRLDIVPEVTARLADALRRVVATPINAPTVVAPVGAGLEGTTAYLASEYVTTDTLDVALRTLAPAPLDRAVPVLRQIAEAIEAAWAVGLGHGALHPRDVFVSLDTLEVRVSGFGVIQALERSGVKLLPRRPYTAPERVAGRAWDIRADVYSLGVLAHELLTGRRPSGAGEQDGALPTGTTPEQRVAIRRALAGVLADNPDERYATPSAFVTALETGEAPVVVTAPLVVDVVEAAPVEPRSGQQTLFRDVEPEPEPQPEPEPAPEPEPEPVPKPVLVPPRSFHVEADEIRRTPLVQPPVVYLPSPEPTRLSGAVIGLIAVALVVGIGIGYWLRGETVATTPADLETVEVAGDQPVGTDVTVTEPAPATGAVTEAAPTPSVAAEPPATRGRLLVRSVPAGARVMISGRARGTTPATVRDLAFGTYNVTVSREGYRTRMQRVTLTRSAPARDITVELTRATPPAPTATTGSVYIDTRPAGAQVTLDGRVVGTAPMRVPDLAPGSHTIRLDLAGHKSLTTTVVVRAGQQVPVRVSLEVLADGGS